MREVINGKRVVFVDDFIVRGMIMRRLVFFLRKVGVKEVYVRIVLLFIRYFCYMGIDILMRYEFIVVFGSVEKVRGVIGVDSLVYLSVEGFIRVVGKKDLCLVCFIGEYFEWVFRF